MASSSLRRTLAVFQKDLQSELRTRYGITALLLFVVVTVTLVVLSAADEPIPPPIVSAVLWVIMCFTAMTGLGRGFISEEERGTALFLRMNSTPLAVYAGKLLINIALAVITNFLGVCMLFLFMSRTSVGSWLMLLMITVVGSIGLAVVLTIVSALVAKAGSRSPLLPVLSFPILVPILMLGTKATLVALAGMEFADLASDLQLILVYTGLLVVVSTLLFDVLWSE
ncbi:MAG: heme exporter protein CcmB [Bradyrhizobiaceae bacterium]|nr:heme exporter protein CcmB [Bradyrhizobiaceae bacterium]